MGYMKRCHKAKDGSVGASCTCTGTGKRASPGMLGGAGPVTRGLWMANWGCCCGKAPTFLLVKISEIGGKVTLLFIMIRFAGCSFSLKRK